MKEKLDIDLIFGILNGSCSPLEKEEFGRWLNEDPEHVLELERLRRLWSVPEAHIPKPDLEQAMKVVFLKAGIQPEQEASVAKKIRFKQQEKPFFKVLLDSMIVRIAVTVFILAGLPILIYRLLDIPTHKAIIVGKGEQKQKMLADGTRVTLDAGSVFRYPSRFGDESREVFLNGEGFFEVVQDKRPFVVNTVTAKITVLGTHFNVRAWHQNQRVVVTVADGSVSLKSKARAQRDEVIIRKGQMSVLARGEPEDPVDVSVDEKLAWLRHEMQFKDAPLREVLEQLERWYDIEIELSDTTLASNRISVFIEDRPIDDILEMLALVNNFNFDHKKKRVVYSPNTMK